MTEHSVETDRERIDRVLAARIGWKLEISPGHWLRWKQPDGHWSDRNSWEAPIRPTTNANDLLEVRRHHRMSMSFVGESPPAVTIVAPGGEAFYGGPPYDNSDTDVLAAATALYRALGGTNE